MLTTLPTLELAFMLMTPLPPRGDGVDGFDPTDVPSYAKL